MQRRPRALTVLVASLLLGGAALAGAAVVQQGNLRITVLSQIEPSKLPRTGTAPIAVFVAGHIATPSGEVPPQLQRMTIDVNRHGVLRYRGLPTCALAKIKTSSSARAIAGCGDALVGSGRFWASVVFPGQRPYPTRGRLLIFNGRQGGQPVLYAHIYTTTPFATSFVVPFSLHHIDRGVFGTELTASFPTALGEWGFVDRIKLTLHRSFSYRGRRVSYFNAGCPAPAGTKAATFALARASFDFAGGREISLTVPKTCRVAR